MLTSTEIYSMTNRLIATHDTRNPFKLCKHLKIQILYRSFDGLLGVYAARWKMHFIFLNQNLDEPLQQMVLAHELGHYSFHKHLMSDKGFQDHVQSNFKDPTEYEANAFAAHLLIQNNDVLELAERGLDAWQIASEVMVHPELLFVKMQEMNKMGTNLHIPTRHNQRFFGDIQL